MKRACFVILIFFFPFLPENAAQTPVDLLNWHRDSLPQESIYLHFDRQAYVAGESVWFRAYLRSGNSPGSKSTNLYVELLDRQGSVLQSKRFPLVGGTASGTLELTGSLRQDVYVVRAYTQWTKNLGRDFVFRKAIPVFSPRSTAPPGADVEPRLEFFPESGKLVAGLTSNIAFRATDSRFRPLLVRGQLLDSRGNSLGVFADNRSEGIFSFAPRAGERYYALARTPEGKSFRQELPQVHDKGVVLIVADEDEGKSFGASFSPGMLATGESVRLLGTIRGEVVLESSLKARDNEVTGQFSTRNFPAGLLHLFLLDNKQQLLTQRTTLVKQDLLLPVELRLNESGRLDSTNLLQFNFPEPVTGSFSVSVINTELELFSDSSDNILSGLLLSAGSLRPVAEPWPADEQQADLLTLTNTWYGADWLQLTQRRPPPIANDHYITLYGKLMRDSLPVSEPMDLLIQGRNLMQTSLRVSPDARGEFTLQGLLFEDTARFYFDLPGVKKNRKTGLALALSEEKEDLHSWLSAMDYSFASRLEPVLEDPKRQALAGNVSEFLSKSMVTLPEVIKHTRNRKESVNNRYASGLFHSSPARVYDFISMPPSRASVNVFDYLQGQVGGLTIEKTGGGYNLFSSRAISTYEQFFGNRRGLVPGKVFLDEVESNTQTVMRIPIMQIAMVKYFEPGALMLPGVGQSPILAVWTKKPEDMATPVTVQLNFTSFAGYSPVRGFFLREPAEKLATLYWNGDIEVSNERQFTVEFRVPPAARRLRLVAQGYTSDGRLLHVERILE